jgi:ADP-heptose:LPS heptosyltransferase
MCVIRIYNLINLILLSIARLFFRRKAMSEGNHILIIRLDAIGDMILFSPFMHALRDNEPDAKITLVVSPLVKSLYENCPYADEILYFDGRKKIKPQIITSTIRAMFWGAKHLKENYSKVFLPRSDSDAEGALMLAITSRCPKIVSFSEKQTAERTVVNRGYDKFTDMKFTTKELKHEVETNLDFLKTAGYADIHSYEPELWFNNEKIILEKVYSSIKNKIDDDDILIALGFTASKESKCWPLDSFREVIQNLSKHSASTKFILIGSQHDKIKAEILAKNLPDVIDMTGKLSLVETAALIKICHMFVGNDSGPVHIAAAVKTPVIEIFNYPGDTERYFETVPIRFAPKIHNKIVLKPVLPGSTQTKEFINSHSHCIKQITVEQVLDSIQQIRGQTLL